MPPMNRAAHNMTRLSKRSFYLGSYDRIIIIIIDYYYNSNATLNNVRHRPSLPPIIIIIDYYYDSNTTSNDVRGRSSQSPIIIMILTLP